MTDDLTPEQPAEAASAAAAAATNAAAGNAVAVEAAMAPAPSEQRDAPAERVEPAEPAEPAERAERAEAAPTAIGAHLATEAELEDWDEHAVLSQNGHVYQSRAWSEYRAAHGWKPWHLVFDDGFRMLVLGRPGGSGGIAYASRGPIPEAEPARSAARAAAAATLVAADGADALVVDGETPAAAGLGRLLAAEGFEPAEEQQPSRHRMDVRLGPDDSPNSDETTIFGSFGSTTRNLIRQAERHDLRVARLDAGGGRAEEDTGTGMLDEFETVDSDDETTAGEMLRTFYAMLDATAKRRGFALASEEKFLDWSGRGIRAGLMFYLEARHHEDGPVAGASFYRHGHRLTYSLAGDRADLRRSYPGAVRLLVWRGIQIALDERRTIVDLGGVDTEGARARPNKGDPTYGMYAFKESFGARWVELTGAYQRRMRARPMHSLAEAVRGRLAVFRR